MKVHGVLSGKELLDNYKVPRIGPVTIANCFFYLSLLEQFEALEKKFKEHLDLFYARAEKRYEIWYQASTRRKNNDPIIPPIDVAYILHAHMLQPHRFYEDNIRLDSQIFEFSMPLKEMHEAKQKGEDEASVSFWKFCCGTDEPYTLEVNDLFGVMELPFRCFYCKSKLHITRVDYSKWRIDNKTSFRCWLCQKTCNLHHASVQKLLNDIQKGAYIPNGYAYIRGTMLKADGTLKSQFNIDKSQIPISSNNISNGSGNNNNKPKRQSFINRAFSIKSPTPAISSPSTPSQDNNTFQTMPSAIMKEIVDDLIWDKTTRMDQVEGVLLEKFNSHLKGLGSKQIASSKEAKLLDLAFAIKRCYNDNPSIFSTDLVQQVKHQKVTMDRMLNIEWELIDDIEWGIPQYQQFLNYMQSVSSHLTAVPAMAIDVVWHTHMMFPQQYRQFCLKYFNRLMEHNDVGVFELQSLYTSYSKLNSNGTNSNIEKNNNQLKANAKSGNNNAIVELLLQPSQEQRSIAKITFDDGDYKPLPNIKESILSSEINRKEKDIEIFITYETPESYLNISQNKKKKDIIETKAAPEIIVTKSATPASSIVNKPINGNNKYLKKPEPKYKTANNSSSSGYNSTSYNSYTSSYSNNSYTYYGGSGGGDSGGGYSCSASGCGGGGSSSGGGGSSSGCGGGSSGCGGGGSSGCGGGGC